MEKHKYADVIHAWADGKAVQRKTNAGEWVDLREEDELRIKPVPPRGPLMRWTNECKGYSKTYATEAMANLNAEDDVIRIAVPLIEAGWCQPIPHDRSDVCPVNSDTPLAVWFSIFDPEIVESGEHVNWCRVTRYAIILPT